MVRGDVISRPLIYLLSHLFHHLFLFFPTDPMVACPRTSARTIIIFFISFINFVVFRSISSQLVASGFPCHHIFLNENDTMPSSDADMVNNNQGSVPEPTADIEANIMELSAQYDSTLLNCRVYYQTET